MHVREAGVTLIFAHSKINQLSLPSEFISRLSKVIPSDQFRAVERTFVERPTSFRCNTLRASGSDVLDILKREGFTVRRLNWLRDGFLLTNKSQRELTRLDIYKEGKIYLQSLASMTPPLALAPKPGERVLDMTAAPGSKTSQIAALMNLQGELHACELDSVRYQKLEHNMRLLGIAEGREPFLTLHSGDANKIFSEQLFHGYFDRILLDAPCSAEARFVTADRRSFSFWSEQTVKKRAAEQKILLQTAWQALKPGGTMLYSTCTFAPEENEVQVSNFLSDHRDSRVGEVPALSGVTLLAGVTRWEGAELQRPVSTTRRILPNLEIEGFFLAKLLKLP